MINPFLGILASALVSFTSVWVYFSELQNGKLGLIDDHEYLSYLGPDRAIDWLEIPAILSQTEVGDWGESTRFRPGYYLLRILQTKFFLGDAYLWYSSRLALFAFALFFLAITFWVLVGRVLQVSRLTSGAVTVFQFGVMTWATMALVSVPSWGDIVTRLGPSELFVFLGLSLMCFGLTLINSRLRSWVGNGIANFGFILAVTSKENAFFLLFPLLIFVLIQLRKHSFRKTNLVMVFVSALVGAWVVGGIVIAISKSGFDTYGEQRTVSGLLLALGGDPRTLLVTFLVLIITVIEIGTNQTLTTAALDKSRNVFGVIRRYPLTLVALSVLSVFFGEHYFYQNSLNGEVFQPARYGMLSELAIVAISLATIFVSLKSFGMLSKRIIGFGIRAFSVLVALWVVYSSTGVISSAAENYPSISKGAVAQKVQQMIFIESMAQLLEAEPAMQVLLYADEPYDFEGVYSLPIFLDFYSGRDVTFYLETKIPDELKPDAFFQGLSNRLDEISIAGGWRISPISEFDSKKQTLCVYFGQPVELDFCTHTVGLVS
jgi:hypothetical protein